MSGGSTAMTGGGLDVANVGVGVADGVAVGVALAVGLGVGDAEGVGEGGGRGVRVTVTTGLGQVFRKTLPAWVPATTDPSCCCASTPAKSSN
jgi:hypothetical protein